MKKNILTEIAVLLDKYLIQINLNLKVAQQNALLAYLQILSKWNKVYNLTAICDIERMCYQHLFDSLSVLPELKKKLATNFNDSKLINILDVGSGAGLPGIPWAIACPEWHITLVDSIGKKTAFLTQTKIELAISNINIVNSKVEMLSKVSHCLEFELIVCRAFASLEKFITLAGSYLKPNGIAVALKGEYPADELAKLKQANTFLEVKDVHKLIVPGVIKQRHIVYLGKI